MRHFHLLLCLLIFGSGLAVCQTTDIEFEDEGPDHIIRLSFVHFLDPLTPGPHVSYEHRIRYNTYLRYELGYAFNFGNVHLALEDLDGFRLRMARRVYRWHGGQIRQRYYWEVAADYRYYFAQVNGDFSRGSFRQRIPYTITQHSLSLNYNRGACYYLGKNWEIDIGLGLGVRLNQRDYSSVPDDASFLTNGGLFWQYGSSREPLHVTLSTAMLFALGYHF